MAAEASDRVHKSCPTCTCDAPYPHTTVYAPNASLYGTCGSGYGCGQVKWQSELWTKRGESITPTRKEHCGCCKMPCQGHAKGAW